MGWRNGRDSSEFCFVLIRAYFRRCCVTCWPSLDVDVSLDWLPGLGAKSSLSSHNALNLSTALTRWLQRCAFLSSFPLLSKHVCVMNPTRRQGLFTMVAGLPGHHLAESEPVHRVAGLTQRLPRAGQIRGCAELHKDLILQWKVKKKQGREEENKDEVRGEWWIQPTNFRRMANGEEFCWRKLGY